MSGCLLPLLLLAASLGPALGEPPLPPASCSASDSLCGRVMVYWSKPAGSVPIERYVVLRDGDSLGSVVPGAYDVNFTLRDTTAVPNVPHAYAVFSWNADGYSWAACQDEGYRLTAPGAPVAFAASRRLCGTVRLAWQPPASGGPVWGYRIVRSAPPGGSIEVSADSREYVDAPGETLVVYSIRAVNCEESAAATDTGRALFSPPPAPTGCSAAIVRCDSLRISWSPAPGADFGHVLLRGDGTRIDSVGPGVVSAGVGGVVPGTDLSFAVRSVNACGRSTGASTAETRIPGPIGMPPEGACAASVDSCRGIRVAWTWAPVDAEWFRVVRVEDGSLVDSVGAGVRSVFDASVAFGDTIAYSIRAGNPCFVSDGSCVASGIRPAIPSAPEQCAATNNLCDRIRVSWFWPSEYLNQNILGFRIYRRRPDMPSAPTDTFTALPRIGAVTFDDTGVSLGINYIYAVAAYTRCGETSGGCQATGIAPTAPGTPALVSPADGASAELPVRLVWRPRPRTASYRLEVATDSEFADAILDTSLADTSYTIARVDTLGLFRWRVRASNACGAGAPSATRTFGISSVPGLVVASGSTDFPFGDGVDTLFEDSVLVLENRWPGYLTWVVSDTLSWVDFVPSVGSLAPGERESVAVEIRDYRCGVVYDESVFVETTPVPPGHGPIGLRVSLDPPPRPVGDVDWNCLADAGDAARIIEALLGDFLETEAESLGADANADGRITVSDVVFLGGRLLEGESPGPQAEGAFELEFAGGPAPILEASAGFPLRAALIFARGRGGDLSRPEAIDPDHTLLRREPATGEVALFWFTDGASPARRVPLLRLTPEEASSGLEVRRIELAGRDGEWIRMSGSGSPVLLAPPARPLLGDVRPNPFNAHARVLFAVPEESAVRIAIHDVRGALVRTILEGPVPAGWREIDWSGDTEDGRAVASGVYFIRLEWRGDTVTRRAVIVR